MDLNWPLGPPHACRGALVAVMERSSTISVPFLALESEKFHV